MTFTDVVFDDIVRVYVSDRARQHNTPTIKLTYAGGTLGDFSIHIGGAPKFAVGHRYVVFSLDDGKLYANPIIGGNQGLFEVIRDSQSSQRYVLTAGRKAVVGFDAGRLRLNSKEVLAITGGTIVAAEPEAIWLSTQPPMSSDPHSNARASDMNIDEGKPVSLEEFIEYVKGDALTAPLESRLLKFEGQGVLQSAAHGQMETEKLRPADLSGLLERWPPDSSSISSHRLVPEDDGTDFKTGADFDGGVSHSIAGGSLGYCGYQDLYLVMEQVSETWPSWWTNNFAMLTYTIFMDIYRYVDDDGSAGWFNENEFCGWVDDATLHDIWGFHWSGALGMTVTRTYCHCCRIWESDVMWNPAYTWTLDPLAAIGDPGLILLANTCIHELGHTWGYMTDLTETYDYDHPSVMHGYHFDVVEYALGIHVPDVYCLRRNYDNQTSILPILDVGVESYWASNGLHNSTTDKTSYGPGEPITIRNVTVENMSFSELSDVRLRFYLSSDPTITTGDHQINGYWYWPILNAESYTINNYYTTVPEVPDGDYYLGALVTINGFGNDDFMENNTTYLYDRITIYAPVGHVNPDMIIFDAQCAGGYLEDYFVISNTGGGTLSGTVSTSSINFKIIGDDTYSLPGGSAKSFLLRFQPVNEGPKYDLIETGNDRCPDVFAYGIGWACGNHCDLDRSFSLNPVDVAIIINYVYRDLDSRHVWTFCPGNNGDWDCNGSVNPLDVTWYVNYVYRGIGDGPCDPCGCDPYPTSCPTYP